MKTRDREGSETGAARRAKLDQTAGELAILAADRASAGDVSARQATTVVEEAATWAGRQEFLAFQGLVTAVTAHLDLHGLLKSILDEAVRAASAERGLLFLGRQDSGGMVPVLAVNLRGQGLETAERVSRTILAGAQAGQLILTQDALADPRFMDEPSIQANRMRSILCTPLVSPTGQVGALYLDSKAAGGFPSGTPDVVQAFSRVAGTALERAQVHGELLRENARLRAGAGSPDPLDRLVGTSERIESARRQARIAALMAAPVLIVGEPGTGKRLLAGILHDLSKRSHATFIGCDCATIPGQLLSGAVLGRMGTAVKNSGSEERGWIAEADRGTLYLAGAEAIGQDLGLALARVAERGAYRPVGGRKERPADVRLLLGIRPIPVGAGGSLPLPASLTSILPEFHLVLPALRERPEDIPALVGHWTRVVMDGTAESGKITFTLQALATLQEQSWPGNVRELRQVLHRALLTRRSDVIDHDHVRRVLAAGSKAEDSTYGPWSGSIRTLQEWEDEAIRQALWQTHDNKAEAARLLGIHRNTLIRKLSGTDRTEAQ